MRFKIQIMILCVLLCIIMSVNAVNSIDINDTQYSVSYDDSILSIGVNDEKLSEYSDYSHVYFNSSAPDGGDGSEESPYNKFNYTINEDTLEFESNFKYGDGTVLYFAKGIYEVEYGLVGNGNLVLMGEDCEKTILNFYEYPLYTESDDSSCQLSIYNLTLNNSFIWHNSVYAENVIFENVVNEYYNLGAIYSSDSVEIENCTFLNNTAFAGAAIYASNAYINNSVFINNTADRGGAIYVTDGSLSITNSKFRQNGVKSYGGAVACESQNVEITNTTFDENYATGSGGAVYLAITNFLIDNTNFTKNEALYGGAICDLYSDSEYYDVKFDENYATYDGGAVYKMYLTATMDNVNFTKNQANNGGALFIDNSTLLNIVNAEFSENTADTLADNIYSFANTNLNVNNESGVYDAGDKVNLIINDTDYLIFKVDESSITDLPGYYDLRDYDFLTPVKNQGPEGNCWAFTSIATLESCILKANGTTFNFSEQNMKNLMAFFSDVGVHYAFPNQGGNLLMSSGYLASWLGPVNEEYDEYTSSCLSSIFSAIMHVQNIYFVQRSSFTGNDDIKKAIMQYGAVGTHMHWEDTYLNNDNVSYYYYCNESGVDYHAVTIVGWNDSYSASNFNHTPAGDGAFIVRNSWGSDWGEDGYFYVSYYDVCLAPTDINYVTFTFILNDTNHYDKNYQYETSIDCTSFYCTWVKNKFIAESDELISAFSLYFLDNYDWEVYVYVNGELKHNQTGSTSKLGYYTFPFTKYIPVKEGDVFEIVLKFTGDNVTVQCFGSYNNERFMSQNQSFISDDGEDWDDLYKYDDYSYVVALKSFTKYGKLNTTISLTGGDGDYLINQLINLSTQVKDQYGNIIKSGKVLYTIGGENYTVNISDGFANKSISFTQKGLHDVLVKYLDGDYYSSSNTAESINVNPVNTNLELEISKTPLLVGDNVTITAKVNSTEGKVSFYINGILNHTFDVSEAVLTLNNLTYGLYMITANFTDENGNYLNSSDNGSFIVSKKSVNITAEDMNFVYNKGKSIIESLSIYISYGDVAVSGLAVSVNGVNKTTNDYGYIYYSDITNWDVGEYNLTISVNSSEYVGEKNVSVVITPESPVLNIVLDNDDLFVGDNVTVTADVLFATGLSVWDKDSQEFVVVYGNVETGNVSFYVNGVLNKTCDVNNPVLTLNNLVYGDYNITVKYVDTAGNYYNQSNEKTFTVSKKSVEIDAEDMNFVYNKGKSIIESLSIYISYENIALSGLNVCVNGVNKTTDSNGRITYSDMNNWDVGKYNITICVNSSVYFGENNVSVVITPESPVLNIVLDNDDLFVGDNVTVTADVLFATGLSVWDKDSQEFVVVYGNVETGNVSFYVNGVLNKTCDVNNPVLTLNNLVYGDYNITVKYVDTAGNYYNQSNEKTFTVSKKTVTINADDIIVIIDDEVTINATTTPEGLNITYTSNNESIAVVDEDGTVTAVGEGTTTITLSVGGDGVYALNTTDVTVTVSKITTEITVEETEITLNISDNSTVPAALTPEGAGNLTYTSNDSQIVTVDENGVITAVSNGTATITVSFAGNDKYGAAENKTITVTVNPEIEKENATIQITAGDITEGEDAIITVNLPEDATGDVSAVVNGKEYTATVENATASLTILDLESGKYTVSITYSGDDKYNSATGNVSLTVNEDTSINVSAPDVTKYYKGFERFAVNVTDSKGEPVSGKNVSITINGVTYTRTTDDNGSASIALGLPAGVYNVTVKVNNISVNSVVTILTTVNGTDIVKIFRNATQYYATFYDTEGNYLSDGTTVQFNINGVLYDRQVSGDNGLARLNINLAAGEYIITAINPVNGEMSSNNITVISRFIENLDIVKYFKNATQYTVKVLDDEGNLVGANESVTFNINGVLYTHQTNESGIAKLNINLSPGDYVITSEYKGCSVSNTIKVSPVLTTSDLTKKYGTSNQFVATLVDGQGNPYANQEVTFNINGVFYTRTTDSEGHAKLNINLMAGQYIITSSYNGQNTANTVTVTA